MPDITDFELNGYFAILFNFTYICLFLPEYSFIDFEGYIVVLITTAFTALYYFQLSRRSIDRNNSEFWIWRNSFNIIGYLGIVFMVIRKMRLDWNNDSPIKGLSKIKSEDVERFYIVVALEHVVIMWKFVIGLMVPPLARWVKQRIEVEYYKRVSDRNKQCGKLNTLREQNVTDLREINEIDFERAFG